jgi:hypothetical protein
MTAIRGLAFGKRADGRDGPQTIFEEISFRFVNR